MVVQVKRTTISALYGERGQKDAKLFTENLLQYSGERKSVARIAIRRRKRFRDQVLY